MTTSDNRLAREIEECADPARLRELRANYADAAAQAEAILHDVRHLPKVDLIHMDEMYIAAGARKLVEMIDAKLSALEGE